MNLSKFVAIVCVWPTWAAITVSLAQPAHAEPACVDDAPHVCQPGNPEGKPAGCYEIGGVLVAEWPCEPWQPVRAPERPYGGKP
jgi:hypothetical protein